MTKLEQKLIELGYKEYKNELLEEHYWYKREGDVLIIWEDNDLFVDGSWKVLKQNDIDNLQQAFNQMQKDLEILKECEWYVD